MPTTSNASSPASVAKTLALRNADTRHAAGKALRSKVPRQSQSKLPKHRDGRDVIAMLEASNQGRVQSLVPIRYGRMLHSPFAFLRGAASIMAFDLARTPASGINVQACGDAHLMNFGGFATPERNLVFDVNEFDATLPAPWEWDIKRLAASVMVAWRYRGFTAGYCTDAVLSTVRAYREKLWEYSNLSPVEVWHARINARDVVD